MGQILFASSTGKRLREAVWRMCARYLPGRARSGKEQRHHKTHGSVSLTPSPLPIGSGEGEVRKVARLLQEAFSHFVVIERILLSAVCDCTGDGHDSEVTAGRT